MILVTGTASMSVESSDRGSNLVENPIPNHLPHYLPALPVGFPEGHILTAVKNELMQELGGLRDVTPPVVVELKAGKMLVAIVDRARLGKLLVTIDAISRVNTQPGQDLLTFSSRNSLRNS